MQADYTIMQLAQADKINKSDIEVVVLSSDYDFLALSPEKAVDAIVDPIRRVMIKKTDVLAKLDCTATELFIAYCIGGCDDIEENLHGIGIRKAMEFVKSKKFTLANLLNYFKKFSGDCLERLMHETTELKALIWTAQPATLDTLPVESQQSMLENFAVEESSPGIKRRECFYQLFYEVFLRW